jgi:hypothetical protein
MKFGYPSPLTIASNKVIIMTEQTVQTYYPETSTQSLIKYEKGS